MHKFLTCSQKDKFKTFKKCSIVPDKIGNHSKLKESHCNASLVFKSQNLCLVSHLYGLEVYKDPIHMLYANPCLSHNSSELETLGLGTRIILNDFLFEKVFDTIFSGVITFMCGSRRF